jgi:hypothetical protein
MPLTSPMTITIGAQAYSLTKKNQDNFGSTWMDNTTVAGTEVKVVIKNAYEGKPKSALTSAGYVQSQMERHSIDLIVTVTDSSGFQTVTQSYQHIRNLRGAVVGDVGNVAQALAAYVTTNADALVAWDN